MSKKNIEAVVRAQFKALNAKDNKERLNYMIAGIEDGEFYTHAHGKQFGVFDTDAPDTVFIPKTDLELSRITGTKIASVTMAMTKFFDDYNGDSENYVEPEAVSQEPETKDVPKKSKEQAQIDDAEAEGVSPEYSEEIVEKLAKECKKAIKSEDFKKAQKILNKLEGYHVHKKLAKKLAKAK